MKEIARGISRIISSHLPSFNEKYDLLAGLVNSWTFKASGIAWWGLEEDKKDLRAPSPFGKGKNRSERSATYYNNYLSKTALL